MAQIVKDKKTTIYNNSILQPTIKSRCTWEQSEMQSCLAAHQANSSHPTHRNRKSIVTD